jgi:ligand-binding SRPBCC domain-containing protein
VNDSPHLIVRAQHVSSTRDETFAFFSDVSNLEALTPPWLRFRILTPQPIALGAGALIDYRLALHRVPLRWRTRIERWEPGYCFVDGQVDGPFACWEHTHVLEERTGGTLILDRVEYRMPLRVLGRLAHALVVGRDLERIFDHRRDAIARMLGGGQGR